jgi:hypothetical protein
MRTRSADFHIPTSFFYSHRRIKIKEGARVILLRYHRYEIFCWGLLGIVHHTINRRLQHWPGRTIALVGKQLHQPVFGFFMASW